MMYEKVQEKDRANVTKDGMIPARIKEKIEVAEKTLLVDFDLLGTEFPFRPGQYFHIRLIAPPYDDDRGSKRHFTIVNSPTERGIVRLTTRLRDSAFKRSLRELPAGTEVEVGKIRGEEFVLPDGTSSTVPRSF
jgi:ferredoxin-NADP reductase